MPRAPNQPIASIDDAPPQAQNAQEFTVHGVKVKVGKDCLSIIRDDMRIPVFTGMITLIGTVALMLHFNLIMGMVLLLPLVVAFFGYFLVYRLLDQKVTITITHGQLSITHNPIPWLPRRVNAKDIKQVYCVERHHSGSEGSSAYYTYTVKLLQKGGRRRKLVAGFRNEEDALHVENTIESFLGIKNARVDASFLEQYPLGILLFLVGCLAAASVPFLHYWSTGNPFGPADSPPAQTNSRGKGKASAADNRRSLKEIRRQKAKSTLNTIRGTRWRGDERLFEFLIEFRQDNTGVVRVTKGPMTLVDSEMTYDVTGSDTIDVLLHISFPNESDFSSYATINGYGSSAYLHLFDPKVSGIGRLRQMPRNGATADPQLASNPSLRPSLIM